MLKVLGCYGFVSSPFKFLRVSFRLYLLVAKGFLVDSEFSDKNLNKVYLKIFLPGFYNQPLVFNKTQQIYEFIIVDSDKDAKDALNITHSTVQFLKVLTSASFGQNLNKTK